MQKKEAETLKKDIDYLDKQREEKQNKLVKLYKEMNMMKPGEPITAAPPKPQDHYVVPGAGQSEIVIELVPLVIFNFPSKNILNRLYSFRIPGTLTTFRHLLDNLHLSAEQHLNTPFRSYYFLKRNWKIIR